MFSTIDNMILDQLDKQNFQASEIASIMSLLSTEKLKSEFNLFLIGNSNTLLSKIDIYKFIIEETKK